MKAVSGLRQYALSFLYRLAAGDILRKMSPCLGPPGQGLEWRRSREFFYWRVRCRLLLKDGMWGKDAAAGQLNHFLTNGRRSGIGIRDFELHDGGLYLI